MFTDFNTLLLAKPGTFVYNENTNNVKEVKS